MTKEERNLSFQRLVRDSKEEILEFAQRVSDEINRRHEGDEYSRPYQEQSSSTPSSKGISDEI